MRPGSERGASRWRGLSRFASALAAVLLLAPAAATSGQGGAVPAARQGDNIAVITIDGAIDMYTELSVKRRLKAAEDAGADAVVIEIDSPGGEVTAVLEVCNAIKASPITNTVAWIHPSAYSGGAIVALACREIVVSDPCSFGDAQPIAFNAIKGGLEALPEGERQKIMAPIIAEVTNSARKNGYDEYLVQAMVSRHIELWLVRDKDSGRTFTIDAREYRMLFDGEPVRSGAILPSAAATDRETPEGPGTGPPEAAPLDPIVAAEDEFSPAGGTLAAIADDVNQGLTEQTRRPRLSEGDRGRYELLGYVTNGNGPVVLKHDGMFTLGLASDTINTDAELIAWFGAKNLSRLDQSWSEGFVRFMTLLPVRGLLVVVFLLGMFLEMSSPGLALPGGVALGALILLLAPPFMVGMASWWEIAAVLLGIVLIFAEIFIIPGFGVCGVVGLIALFVGLVGTFVPDQRGKLFPDSPGAQSDMLYGVATLLMALVTSGIGMYLISKHFGTLPLLSRLVLSDQPEDDDEHDPMLAAMARPVAQLAVGAEGVAHTPLRPAGKAEFDGRIFDVVTEEGYIDAGTAVKVSAVSEFRILVEPA